MIITRTPFRISLCGGGSDISAFYRKHGGCVISVTINKYMYITSHPSFDGKTILAYSKIEEVDNVNNIEHNIFRECLKKERIEGIEITSIADVPQGTGLGSSSSFTVGLINNLRCYKKEYISKQEMADYACNVENNIVHTTNGKQDQYAAAFGGLNFYKFNRDGSVDVEPIVMDHSSYKKLEKNLIMLYVGGIHNASNILKEQTHNIITSRKKERSQLEIVKLTNILKKELLNNNIDAVGTIMDKNWELKKSLAKDITNPKFDKIYARAKKAGAIGGKLLGAGGGGFFLFYVPQKKQAAFRNHMKDLYELKFKFDHLGSVVVFYS